MQSLIQLGWHVEDGFRWWIERVRATFTLVDIARADHWWICGLLGNPVVTRPQSVGRGAPGKELFTAIRGALVELPIIAEDLGVITPDVVALREAFGFPGMRILQFGFGGDTKNIDLPHNYVQNVVSYTGTHDNDTTVGWFHSVVGEGSTRTAKQIEREQRFCLDYLHSAGKGIRWDVIRGVFASVANNAIVPLQDVLGLGTSARMNLPNSMTGNWSWRYTTGALTDQIGKRLKDLTEHGRTWSKLWIQRRLGKGFQALNEMQLVNNPKSAGHRFGDRYPGLHPIATATEIQRRTCWWIESSVNPVRLMVHGRNFKGAQVKVAGQG